MADAAELVVRIRGDASDLEATISGVSQQLEELERTQSNTNGVKGVRESTSAYQGLASQLKETGKGIKEVGESIDTITKPIQYASTALAAGGVAAPSSPTRFVAEPICAITSVKSIMFSCDIPN